MSGDDLLLHVLRKRVGEEEMTLRPEASPCTIGDICDFQSGNGFGPQDWKTKGLPIIRIQNLNGSRSFNYFDGEPDPAWIVEPDDLLFAWAGVKGVSFGPTIWNGPKGVLNQHIYRIRSKKGINNRWLYYALAEVTTEIESKAHGFKTSLVHVRKDDITRARISLPDECEQEAVASALECWDAAIQETEQLITAKQKRTKSLSNDLLFGHVRFARENTHSRQVLHWFSCPSDWKVVEIGKVAREISAINGGGDDLPVLSCTKYDGLVDSLAYFDKQVFSHNTSKYKVVRHGQFAYATNHIEEGSIGYQNRVPIGLVSPIYTVFQADSGRVDDGYLYKLLKTEKLRQIFAANTNASVDRRGSLRWKEFERIHIPLPSLDEQRKITTLLDEATREVSLLKAKSRALRLQKRGLMQKLLTGQWRLPISEKAEVSTDA